VAGVHGNPHEGRYTEDFGATFMERKLETFMHDNLMRGMVIWSWADYRHRHGFYGDGMHLKASFGPYGLVTIDRKEKPKLYALLKKFYTNWNP
jgi:beta-glucuronidase